MIDVSLEQPISFNEAAQYLPDGRRPAFSTWWRWYRAGIKGVRLETVLCGGRRCTTAEAVQRFFDRVTAAADGTIATPSTSKQRRASIARAEDDLARAGI